MPELDGYGVLHLVQKNPDLESVPFIFLSARFEQTDIRKGMNLGANDYITKPFSASDLQTAVENCLKKVQQAKQTLPEDPHGFSKLLSESMDKAALQELASKWPTNKYRKKQPVYNEGNYPNHLYQVQKGKVKLFKTNEDGKELIVSLHQEGDFFGYTALLEGSSYKENAMALDDCDITEIPKEAFELLMNTNWEVTQKFIQLLAKNVTILEKQLIGIAYNSLRKKVADALSKLLDKCPRNDNGIFEIDVSRENLAAMAGTATESLIRTLSDFKLEKLIEIQDGKIFVLNEMQLRRLAS
jgi:CRP-like cAMP-binding protein